MFWNNVVLLSIWGLMCWAFGTAPFFMIYLICLSVDVTRLKLSHIPNALKYILWDRQAQRIISVAEYRAQTNGMRCD
jgi:hypothetical protein